MSDTCIIIPARFKSSRFPGKPLVKLLGKEMILWVAEIGEKVLKRNHVFIATDNDEIEKIALRNNFKCIKTKKNALTGTDRVALAAKELNYKNIINIQGDEPLVSPEDIEECIHLKNKYPHHVINGFCQIGKDEDPLSINIPKLVINSENELIYISRSLIPGRKSIEESKNMKYFKQVCIYGFSNFELNKFNNFGKKSYLEELEDIEILRFKELDIKIKMFKCKEGSIAVDIPSDVAKVEKKMIEKYK